MRLMVAVAAPVTMLVAPGPIELTQAKVRRRLLILAKAVAMCTEACSFLVMEIAELRILLQRLANAGDAAVAENAEAAGKERLPPAVALDMLVQEELNDGLRHGQSFGFHKPFLLNSCKIPGQNPPCSAINFNASSS